MVLMSFTTRVPFSAASSCFNLASSLLFCRGTQNGVAATAVKPIAAWTATTATAAITATEITAHPAVAWRNIRIREWHLRRSRWMSPFRWEKRSRSWWRWESTKGFSWLSNWRKRS
ncbi:hypothetical protein V8G54_020665 [Vigna mungo]|uniref:Uncharacterized protein n=1 Tax=Vigna mungo TaxID=3915 RepID=A0AAQ3NC84_VIGMU